MTNYNIQDEVYVVGDTTKAVITEISIQPTKTEYKLWKPGGTEYHWFDSWQITKEEPTRIGFKTN